MVLCPGMARWSLPHYHPRDVANVSVLVCGQNQKGNGGVVGVCVLISVHFVVIAVQITL